MNFEINNIKSAPLNLTKLEAGSNFDLDKGIHLYKRDETKEGRIFQNICKEIIMTEHRGGSGNFAEDKEKASEAGKKGGQHSEGNFKNDPERAAEAGHKGGQNSGGNFKNDPERAAEAGHKGGEKSGGNFKNDSERAAEAGHKGGQNSHRGS